MALPEHTKQWAEEYIRMQRNAPSIKSETWADEFLSNELQNQHESFFISEAALCAVEITKGGKPVNSLAVANQLNQHGFKILDDVVFAGGSFDNSESTEAFNLELVMNADLGSNDPKLAAYGERIRKAEAFAPKIREICNDDALAGSLLRLLAIRNSLRLSLLSKEIESHSAKDRDFQSLLTIQKKIDGLIDGSTANIRSFFLQLSALNTNSTPYVPPPTLPKVQDKTDWLPNLFIFVACASIGLLLAATSSDKKPKPNWTQPKVQSDPMASFRAVEKYGAYHALQEYIHSREMLPKLWTAIRALKDGIVSTDKTKFTVGKDYLKAAAVDPEQVESYIELRTTAALKREREPRPDFELEKAMQSEWAEWFDGLPECEESDDWLKGLSTEQRVTKIELEVAKKRKEEIGPLDEVLRILTKSRNK